MKTILITGGAGYIGSHTTVELLEDNLYNVILLDNFSNSNKTVLNKITKITNKSFICYEGDIRDNILLDNIFNNHNIDYVIHFVGKKSIDESNHFPLDYYSNNVIGTITLLDQMNKHNVKNFIFSSSATVYGKQDIMPIKEDAILGIQTNPYGKTKRMIEEILEDLYKSDNSFNITILRYFNPIGAHKSGLIGEIPNGVPNNLVPYITQVLSGKLPFLKIYGNDYNTPDGTGIRDFIHVVDLAHAHILALSSPKGFNIFNVGTGKGYSVLDVVNCFEKVTNKTINKIICDRRQGDVDICYADISKIKSTLGFNPSKSLEDCCLDQWLFELNKDK